MTRLTKAAIAAFLGLTALMPAHADTQSQDGKPGVGYSLDLGKNRGTGYYVETPAGYHLVLTLGAENANPVRFETDLVAGQTVELSSPGPIGEAGQAIRITREGDHLTVATLAAPARFAAE